MQMSFFKEGNLNSFMVINKVIKHVMDHFVCL